MLATPGPLPSAAVEDQWAFEVKQDGQRAVIYLPGDGTILVRARSGTDITTAYPELLPLAHALGARSAVLDGEIVALDEQGCSDFERLQQRIGLVGSPTKAARMASRVPTHLMLFDLVHLNGRLLTRLPYAERREVLEGLGLAGPAWSTPAAITGHGAEAWEMAQGAGLEGLIAKRLTSRYEPGARSKTWVKIKVHRVADVVIGGWVPGRGRLTGLPAFGRLGRGWRVAPPLQGSPHQASQRRHPAHPASSGRAVCAGQARPATSATGCCPG